MRGVRATEAAIDAVIDAGTGEVEGCEGNDAVIIDFFLYGGGGSFHFAVKVWGADADEGGEFWEGEGLDGEGFIEDVADAGGVWGAGVLDEASDEGVVDEVAIFVEVFINFVGTDTIFDPLFFFLGGFYFHGVGFSDFAKRVLTRTPGSIPSLPERELMVVSVASTMRLMTLRCFGG